MSINADESEAVSSGQVRYMIVQPVETTDKEHFAKSFPTKAVFGLSVSQLAIFLLVVVVEIVLITLGDNTNTGVGIWTGLFFGISGGLGIFAAQRPSHCTVVSLMVMSILAACFAVPLTVLSGIGFIEYRWGRKDDPGRKVLLSLKILFGLVELVIAVLTSALCCRATSCCRENATTGAVVYNASSSENQAPPGTLMIPLHTVVTATGSHPPKYNEVTEAKCDPEEQNASKYSRFE